MLIKCPECKKEISNKATTCIHCGYPLNEMEDNNVCVINNVEYNLEKAFELYKEGKELDSCLYIKNIAKISTKNAKIIYEEMTIMMKIPKKFTTRNYSKDEEVEAFKWLHSLNNQKQSRMNNNQPTCPKCGSTAITAGQKGYSLWTGFLGSNKTMNRCANCGHAWKPGK